MFQVRPIESSDICEIVNGWNQVLIYDNVSEQWFEEIIFRDPNYERDCNLVAVRDGVIVGFIGIVAREGILGRDGRGILNERDDGYIKGFYILDDYWSSGIKEMLLKEALEHLRSKGKSIIKVVEYTGQYFFPGIDSKYETLLNYFDENGFVRKHMIQDVVADLKDLKLSDYQIEAKQRVNEIGVEIKTYKPAMLDKMREFVDKLNIISWFPSGWEKNFGKSDCTYPPWYGGYALVALMNDNIVGWASYVYKDPISEFGSTGVLDEYRHKGVGTCLLLESMLRLKELGAQKVVAKWAATGFYLKKGFKIDREYIVYQKTLSSQS